MATGPRKVMLLYPSGSQHNSSHGTPQGQAATQLKATASSDVRHQPLKAKAKPLKASTAFEPLKAKYPQDRPLKASTSLQPLEAISVPFQSAKKSY